VSPRVGDSVLPDDLARQLIVGTIRTYRSRELLFCEGDRATCVYKIEAGNVCVYKLMRDGRRQVIDFAFSGDVIGLGALGEHAVCAQATTMTHVLCIPVSILHRAIQQDACLSLKLYEAMSRELLAARELVCTVGQRRAPERVAGFLIALSRRARRCGESGDVIVLPMTRGDIADFLGLTIETVSRTFTKFRARGLIELRRGATVTIRDAKALADLAEGMRRAVA
jgi:CRP/FNR family transcriptional regulator